MATQPDQSNSCNCEVIHTEHVLPCPFNTAAIQFTYENKIRNQVLAVNKA